MSVCRSSSNRQCRICRESRGNVHAQTAPCMWGRWNWSRWQFVPRTKQALQTATNWRSAWPAGLIAIQTPMSPRQFQHCAAKTLHQEVMPSATVQRIVKNQESVLLTLSRSHPGLVFPLATPGDATISPQSFWFSTRLFSDPTLSTPHRPRSSWSGPRPADWESPRA
jgi:hypothetical protein